MAKTSSKDLALVLSAIKKMQGRRGANPRQILHYISSTYNIPETVAKRQVLTALKRGTTQGFLRETDGHYSLPTREEDFEAIATQELGLLDLACRKRKQQQRKKKIIGACGGMKRGRSRRRKSMKKKSRKSSSCGGKRSKSRKRKSKARKRRKSRGMLKCGSSKKSRKSRRRSGKKGKRGKKGCACPKKKRSKPKSGGCAIKMEKKPENKCHMNLFDILRGDKTRSRSRSRSRMSTYYGV